MQEQTNTYKATKREHYLSSIIFFVLLKTYRMQFADFVGSLNDVLGDCFVTIPDSEMEGGILVVIRDVEFGALLDEHRCDLGLALETCRHEGSLASFVNSLQILGGKILRHSPMSVVKN